MEQRPGRSGVGGAHRAGDERQRGRRWPDGGRADPPARGVGLNPAVTHGRWQPLGGDTRGQVTALAQAAPDAVFAATPVGVFRSRDAGLSWERAGSTTSVAFAETLATSA